MTKKIWVAMIAMCLALVGCGSAAKGLTSSLDKKAIASELGKNYQEMIENSGGFVGVDYGKLIDSPLLKDGTQLKVHVYEYESSRSSVMGIWGSTEHSYKINVFKIKQDNIIDWAYALHTPDQTYTHIFGFEIGFDDQKIQDQIKQDYAQLAITSTGSPLSTWN